MNIKELKTIIKDLPDDMEVGGAGHCGELLTCYSIATREVIDISSIYNKPRKTILCVNLEDAGEYPE